MNNPMRQGNEHVMVDESDIKDVIPWDNIRLFYENSNKSFVDLAQEYGVNHDALVSKASVDNWVKTGQWATVPSRAQTVVSINAAAANTQMIDAEWIKGELASLYREQMFEGDLKNARATLETLGKHRSIQAFKENISVEGVEQELSSMSDEELVKQIALLQGKTSGNILN